MIRIIIRRLLLSIPTLLLLSILVFILFKMIPGDYLTEMELNPTISTEQLAQLREDLGLNRSVPEQYFIWLSRVLAGDLGYSFAQRRPATALIGDRMANTLVLTLLAFSMIVFAGLPLGILAALRKGSLLDRAVLWVSMAGLSLPSVLSALLMLYIAFWTGWFPIGGSDTLWHAVAPALTLSLPAVSFIIRTTRLEMADVLSQPYILAVAAKGLPQWRVIWHALRNALNPLISLLGLTLGGLLSGAVVVEKVFSWPGLGSLAIDSILSRDLYVALGCVLVSACMVILANLIADVLLALNDPKVRQR